MHSVLSFGEGALHSLVVLAVAAALGLILHAVVFAILGRLARRTRTGLDDAAVSYLRGPSRLFVLLLALKVATPLLRLAEGLPALVDQITSILLIAAVTWLVIAATRVGRALLSERFDVSVADNLQARKIHTQYDVLSKIIIALAVILGVASVLMTFDQVRQLGAGILASAGIVGIIVGFSAQKSLATLFAGIQIALTQPIRLDDVVIVEGEWGRIEEITLTYVVVRIWDQRRLVVPITYFIETPFQNWTRVSAEMLGTVFLFVDHTVPLDALREELQRIVRDDERWDGRVAQIVMTDVTQATVQVRALVSAADSGRAWDLRCQVREKLVAFVREHYPQALPRLRAELAGQAAAGQSSEPTL
ncbi:MAG: mechanosensitive ion channel [Candidatus Krumholzibacteria bacterium]|jgi:small-conductance mechanosensitive channel|nr:mechanosensitive ion channel [Candidatus Krumholzibacteria bacterium]